MHRCSIGPSRYRLLVLLWRWGPRLLVILRAFDLTNFTAFCLIRGIIRLQVQCNNENLRYELRLVAFFGYQTTRNVLLGLCFYYTVYNLRLLSTNCTSACRCQVHSDVKVPPTSDLKDGSKSETWRIKMLYDGDCPLCMREVCCARTLRCSFWKNIASFSNKAMINEHVELMGTCHQLMALLIV